MAHAEDERRMIPDEITLGPFTLQYQPDGDDPGVGRLEIWVDPAWRDAGIITLVQWLAFVEVAR